MSQKGQHRQSGKNDVNDAEAIFEAVGRPNMRFVPPKSEEQQALLMVHRARSLVVANRTAQVNQIRGLLGDEGHPKREYTPGATASLSAEFQGYRWRES
jgi:transposase